MQVRITKIEEYRCKQIVDSLPWMYQTNITVGITTYYYLGYTNVILPWVY